MEVRPIHRGRADGQCPVEECQSLLVGSERRGALRRTPERDPGLRRERIGLRPLGGVVQGGEIVTGKGARQLVGPERLEESCGREVPRLAVSSCERVVGDLPDERLDEPVLPALRRASVDVLDEHLAPDERAEAGLDDLRTPRPRPRRRPPG